MNIVHTYIGSSSFLSISSYLVLKDTEGIVYSIAYLQSQ